MKNYKKIAAMLVIIYLVTAFLGVMDTDGVGTVWPEWLCFISLVSGVAAVILVSTGEKKSAGATKPEAETEKKTYRKMLENTEPCRCGTKFIGGCQGCPGDYFPGAPKEDELGCFYALSADEYRCDKCWDQEVSP